MPKAAKKTDREILCGTWVLVSQTCAGVTQTRDLKWVFTDRVIELTADHATSSWEVALDSSRDPKTIDFRSVIQRGGSLPFTGIYALDGDDFKVSYDALDRTTRPKDLTGNGPTDILWVFKRKKP
jgi:uncharacterized protein (TIGR03067 family)